MFRVLQCRPSGLRSRERTAPSRKHRQNRRSECQPNNNAEYHLRLRSRNLATQQIGFKTDRAISGYLTHFPFSPEPVIYGGAHPQHRDVVRRHMPATDSFERADLFKQTKRRIVDLAEPMN
jgi:hypothetical protein